MFVKIERDECQIYFINDSKVMASRWGCELDLVQLHELRKAEKEFWHWQEVIEQGIKKCMNPKAKSMRGKK